MPNKFKISYNILMRVFNQIGQKTIEYVLIGLVVALIIFKFQFNTYVQVNNKTEVCYGNKNCSHHILRPRIYGPEDNRGYIE